MKSQKHLDLGAIGKNSTSTIIDILRKDSNDVLCIHCQHDLEHVGLNAANDTSVRCTSC